ncbi:pyridine nucleotide-disulfide oxidoreductase [Streptomyces sp. TRM70308]|uniref:pyridine nucleotide-disulfide oxidoreductase n=1 Tax=Streptomyces sp. TRM70308 TaxID=3131932 RepID=UPI003D025108
MPAAVPGPRGAGTRRAVVVGGGLAGMLSAAAVRHLVDAVDVVEPHALPAAPVRRRGLPQARHAHVLVSGGAGAIERLLPGTTERLLAAGARRVPLPTGLVSYTPEGWNRRWLRATQYLVTCSRDLLDHVVRTQVLRDPRVRVVPGRVTGLLGDRRRVTGVCCAPQDGPERALPALLVVDAAGRATRLPGWLAGLGVTGLVEERVDSGLVYASRLYRAPTGDPDWPVVMVQADSRQPRPGQSATVVPVEGDRWLVSLSGTRGGEPTRDPDAFVPFARGLRHAIVGELLARAEPLSDVALTRGTANERRRYERLADWPDGLVAVGDSVAAYNPVYGHGMSVAAQGALAVREVLTRTGPAAPGAARRAQRAVAAPVGVAWALATGQDVHYPHTTGASPTLGDRVLQRYARRLALTGNGTYRAASALTDVMSLTAAPHSLGRPGVLLSALVGPLRPPLTGPQFTARERALLRGEDA